VLKISLRRAVRILATAALLTAAGCATASAARDSTPAAPVSRITAVSVEEGGGSILLIREAGGVCSLERLDPESGSSAPLVRLASCADRIERNREGDLLLRGGSGVIWLDHETLQAVPWEGESNARPGLRLYDALGKDTFAWERTEGWAWRRGGELEIIEGDRPLAVTLLSDGETALVVAPTSDGRVTLTRRTSVDGSEILLGSFDDVPSFDIDRSEEELVISVVRDGSRDIAIANARRERMNWVPADRGDEVMPLWAPRGYKVSFVIRNASGDLLRSVHVPTAAMTLVDFPHSTVRGIDWFPDGDRLVVAVSGPLASDHLLEAHYDHGIRRELLAPEYRFAREVDRMSGTPPGSLMVLPGRVGYGDRHPVVIWTRPGSSSGMPFESALVPLLATEEMAVVLVNGSGRDLDPSFWNELAATEWVEPSLVWLIETVGDPGESIPDGVRVIPLRSGGFSAEEAVEEILAHPELSKLRN
jgi:hypothetical protein